MLAFRSFLYLILTFPIKLLVRCKIVPDDIAQSGEIDKSRPIFYILRNQSASDILVLQNTCKKLGLPDPLEEVSLKNKSLARVLCLEKPARVSRFLKKSKTSALEQGQALLQLHADDKTLDAQLIPINLVWGRTPTKEKNNANVGTILADQESPSFIRKFFIVLFLGRNSLIRFSPALSLRYMADSHGSDIATAHKLMRVARFHFHRQTIAAKGPRLMHRQQMFTALLANPSVKRMLADEVKSKGISQEKAKKQALAMMDEIAGDYRDSMVRVGERVLNWLWKRLYKGIEVNNANVLRELAQEGHEIIYVPCHRSHMDYLLLTYVIFHQGLVTPRIAAGINLNFWPAGPIFRKSGAFFIRSSFGGNRMYSTIFREYLGLLFERGYSVKYYTEGGRSRTGRVLQPKTGMLAMTIQSLLRGIDRPLTLVPVYVGYEHVMEVGSYHKELSGTKKQNESIFSVLKAIKSLRNYGKGYVNFGTPININQFLNKQVPNWKDAIDPIDPQKPSWLTPSVNVLANQVMTAVNKSAALNAVSLVAMILHASENKALSKKELIEQLDFFLNIQRHAPYSNEVTVPAESGTELLTHVIELEKVNVQKDTFGDIITLSDTALLEIRYYRNNILHTYIVPSLVCRIVTRDSKVHHDELVKQVQALTTLCKTDLFLWQCEEVIAEQVTQVVDYLASISLIKQSKAGFWSLVDNNDNQIKLNMMSEVIDETLQRFAIISRLASKMAPISKAKLETSVIAIAERLSVLNNINAPEFIDKKAQGILINSMKESGYLTLDEQGCLVCDESLTDLNAALSNLVNANVLQSIDG